MRKFNVGDVVTWINPAEKSYEPGPYIVVTVHPAGDFNKPSVFVTHMDGSPLHFYRMENVKHRHVWINEERLRLEPFLDAARKAVADAKA